MHGGTVQGDISFEISGANTRAAAATPASVSTAPNGSAINHHGIELVTGLSAGSTTFTMKYRSNNSGSNATWSSRVISVLTF